MANGAHRDVLVRRAWFAGHAVTDDMLSRAAERDKHVGIRVRMLTN